VASHFEVLLKPEPFDKNGGKVVMVYTSREHGTGLPALNDGQLMEVARAIVGSLAADYCTYMASVRHPGTGKFYNFGPMIEMERGQFADWVNEEWDYPTIIWAPINGRELFGQEEAVPDL
jgi:hypothetical protein